MCEPAGCRALLLLCGRAEAAEAPRRPDIVVVLIDDLRFDEIDYPFVKVPNIQRLAREVDNFVSAPRRIGDPRSGPALDELKRKLDRIPAETR